MLSFLTVAQLGKNAWWRYLLSLLLIVMVSGIGFEWIGRPLARAIAWQLASVENLTGVEESEQDGLIAANNSPEFIYLSSHIAYLFLGISLLIVVQGIHRRNPLTLISPDSTIRFKRFFYGFTVWFSFACLQTLVEGLLNPHDFIWNFHPLRWLAFLPLALLLTPIQTSTEELLFRGYILQGLGLIIRQPILLTIVASLPFAIVHFSNPEMGRGAIWIGLAYFVLALFLTIITLKDNRLELALGVHAANNLFIVLFVNTQDSALQTPAIVLQQVPTDARVTLVLLIMATGVFYYLFFGRDQRL